MSTLVSPKYTEDKLSSGDVGDLIDVYEDRVLGWTLKPAKALLSDPDACFAVLSIVLSYFETFWIFRTGEASEPVRRRSGRKGRPGRSQEFFVAAFCEIFPPGKAPKELGGKAMPPEFQELLGETLYRKARCGLFHQGMTKHGIAIGEIEEPISCHITAEVLEKTTQGMECSVEIDGIIVNPKLFVESIEVHLGSYVRELRDPRKVVLRENLIRGWNATRPRTYRPFPTPPGKDDGGPAPQEG